jgi:predicted neuraminidase
VSSAPASQAAPDRSLFDGLLRADPADPRRVNAYLATPTVQNHASLLATLPDGDLGLVWFGGTQEGVGDVSIWFARLAPGAARWSEPTRLTDDPERSEQNPILFPTPTGELWLLYTAQRAGNQDTAQVRRRVSTDSGRSWGEVETLFPADERGGVFVRQPVVVTGSGRWLLPIFRCVTVPGEPWTGDVDTSAVLVSDDRGSTWREVPVPESVGCVHMSIVDLGAGELFALFRSRWADHVYASRSVDDGASWTAPTPTELPNNNSSIQLRRLDDGRLGLVFNNSSRLDATQRRLSLYDEIDEHGIVEGAGPAAVAVPDLAGPDDGAPGAARRRRAFWGAPRAPMTLAFSCDRGATWQLAGNLDEGDGYCLTNNSRDGLNRELSYPAIHQAADGALHLSYTYHRQTIKHVRVPSTWTQDRA